MVLQEGKCPLQQAHQGTAEPLVVPTSGTETATQNPARLSATQGLIGMPKIPVSTPIHELVTIAKLTLLSMPNSYNFCLALWELPEVQKVQMLHSCMPREVLRVQDAPHAGGVSISTHSVVIFTGVPGRGNR